SAVGGGTMLGLGALLLKTTDPHEIDALALAGDRNGVDLSIAEAIGGKIAGLPPTATASNFGRVGRNPRTKPSRQDLAAAIITLVAQTISVIAINAARAESLPNIVFVGHMMDMASMRKACLAVANLYRVKFTIAKTPGLATAMGALQGLGGVAPTPNP
ncbi:MAG: Fumble domain-containing protein, partial [Anaerolineae bacterium]